MKILLDENLPHDLRYFLSGHEVFTVAYMGWSGMENGELMKIARNSGFDVMLTKDSGVAYEQPLAALAIAVVVMKAKLDDIRPLVPAVLSTLANLQSRTLVRIG